ncbi:MAG: hypothetical protein EAZ16_01935 [Sphingobacteriales bacterium]|jgi:hypothetical protein|nr:MAG: hypothetical protein EAZ16_01935 [Sphingobacteriales bacterium]
MKRTLLFSLLTTVMVTGFSCSAVLETPEDRIEGTWVLERAERNNFFNWQDIYTGYEAGEFTFYNNGDVVYRDNLGNLNGRWYMQTINDGYYDSNGNYQETRRNTLSLRLYNFSNNRIIDWVFDDFNVNRYRFTAQYETPNYQYRYKFYRK